MASALEALRSALPEEVRITIALLPPFFGCQIVPFIFNSLDSKLTSSFLGFWFLLSNSFSKV
jgi:hypothetical protein